jgi:LacI family transcriptional regulator
LRNQLVEGVIVSALPIEHPLVEQLLIHQLPFVMVGRPSDPSAVNFVDVDNVTGAYSAVSHLVRLGYRQIATITCPSNTMVGQHRRQGYVNALNDRGLSVDERIIVEGDFTEQGGYQAMQQLIPHRPEAVFVGSDTMALGALRALRQAGLAVPRDMALVGYDDLPSAAVSDPPLTTIRQPIRRLGAQAVENLLDILDNDPYPPRHVIAPTELIIRESCGSNSG